MLVNENPFKHISSDILNFIESHKLIAHNSSFDMSFINRELIIAGKSPIDKNRFECTKLLSQSKFKSKSGLKLDELCDRYKIDRTNRLLNHSSMIDTLLLADVYPFLKSDEHVL